MASSSEAKPSPWWNLIIMERCEPFSPTYIIERLESAIETKIQPFIPINTMWLDGNLVFFVQDTNVAKKIEALSGEFVLYPGFNVTIRRTEVLGSGPIRKSQNTPSAVRKLKVAGRK